MCPPGYHHYGIMAARDVRLQAVTHCSTALWSHQSARTTSSERCINANSERLSERLSTQSIRVLNRIYLEHNIKLNNVPSPVTTIMALWQLVNLGTRCTVTHCRIAFWSHQSAQTARSGRCINANSETIL